MNQVSKLFRQLSLPNSLENHLWEGENPSGRYGPTFFRPTLNILHAFSFISFSQFLRACFFIEFQTYVRIFVGWVNEKVEKAFKNYFWFLHTRHTYFLNEDGLVKIPIIGDGHCLFEIIIIKKIINEFNKKIFRKVFSSRFFLTFRNLE